MAQYRQRKLEAKTLADAPPEIRKWKRALVFYPNKVPTSAQTQLPDRLRIYETELTIQVKEQAIVLSW